jgi:hypothetical protein
MALTRIDSLDFVSSINSTSDTCWVSSSNQPVYDTLPTFGTTAHNMSGSVLMYTDYYIGNPSNVQFSYALVDKNEISSSSKRKQFYAALRNIVYGDKNAEFIWGGTTRTLFSVISINKSRYKTALLPGSLRLGNLTDDSHKNPPQMLNCGRAYNLVLGSTLSGGGFSYGTGTGAYGLFLPDIGIILTNGSVPTALGIAFQLYYEDAAPTNSVFIRARNSEYNYSANPSFISGSSGIIIRPEWYNNPQAYVTSIGLYNDNNELLATAKLPRPYNKNFNNEALFQVNLNF